MRKYQLSLLATAMSVALVGCGGDARQHVECDGPSCIELPEKPQDCNKLLYDCETGLPRPPEGPGALMRLATAPLGIGFSGLEIRDGELFFATRGYEEYGNMGANGGYGGFYKQALIGGLYGESIDDVVVHRFRSVERGTDAYANHRIRIAHGAGDETDALIQREYHYLLKADGDDAHLGFGAIEHLQESNLNTGVLESLSQRPVGNRFVASNPEGTEGYLFSFWDTFPGGFTRTQIARAATAPELPPVECEEGVVANCDVPVVQSWDVAGSEFFDLQALQGTAGIAASQMTPWQTPLFAENSVVMSTSKSTSSATWNQSTDGLVADDPYVAALQAVQQDDRFPNPYRYGYQVEITEPTLEIPTVVKHFAMGRFEQHSAVIMPDRQTVYLSQRTEDGVLYRFVADAPEHLSEGTLFAAKVNQDSDTYLDHPERVEFELEWIELGHTSSAQVEAWISDFDGIGLADFVDEQSSYLTLEDVKAWSRWVDAGRPADGHSYPSVEEGGNATTASEPMDDRVAFLESRQAAIAQGATAEWYNLSGLTANLARVEKAIEGTGLSDDVEVAYLYFAIPEFFGSMAQALDASHKPTGSAPSGDIRLDYSNAKCGGIYRMPVQEGYEVTRIEPVIMGGDLPFADHQYRCDWDQITSPQEIVVRNDGILIVAEEYKSSNNGGRGGQQNASMWMFHPVD
ncbi:alkaline phosphatase PhoX [Ferrimonas pelagia]|uniref:Lipoprotein n=1 Tax=Ferrimonas pelagia TaxID=1177826 RepID=A0ABP9FJ85_9GAMM